MRPPSTRARCRRKDRGTARGTHLDGLFWAAVAENRRTAAGADSGRPFRYPLIGPRLTMPSPNPSGDYSRPVAPPGRGVARLATRIHANEARHPR